ncbi:MAG TPA: dUTP diphosphatase [Dictyoglomaceae bacterium]|nr:dUTP diphosphatase [Dictyoglomaceae bacterium]HOL40081.1 dUTP diphosphatase [Dictyoglomaceae bacterium]HOP95485.1 dUTP diphosphatase [Dictyoglomaceae bacterium]HPP16591.1 dUTP diphosphatase [Dictyoglomaceae bacterium]HPU43172.1 dUTP diphosphatase [Dictyoglomaceae bacterium]
MKILIERIDKEISLPVYATSGSVAVDLSSRIDFILYPFCEIEGGIIVPTGIRVAIPEGYLGFVLPRSGLSAKNGITILNTPGLIDSDYRGEILVNLINFSKEVFYGKKGMRIAQFLILSYSKIDWEEVEELPETERGENGLGSTGL